MATPVAAAPQSVQTFTGPLFDEVNLWLTDQHALRVRLYHIQQAHDFVEVDVGVGVLERETGVLRTMEEQQPVAFVLAGQSAERYFCFFPFPPFFPPYFPRLDMMFEVSVGDINNNNQLVAENNAFERLPRYYNNSRPVYRNAWPSVQSSTILDGKTALAVVQEQTHTVTNPSNGVIQLMVHRRADIKGLSAPVVLDDATPHRERVHVRISCDERMA